MNWGIFGWAYGAVLDTCRRRIKYGQGASKVNFEAVVLGTTDTTTGMLRSPGGAAPALNYADLVLQVPYIAGRRGQAYLATGALSVTLPDGTIAGGNRRGVGAVDLQATRTLATLVASGIRAVISGGTANISSGLETVVAGGSGNAATSPWAAVGGGTGNSASGQNSYVFGGEGNSASGAHSAAGGYASNARGISRKLMWNHAGKITPRIITTNATATIITSDGGAAAATNVNVLPNDSTYAFSGKVVARKTTGNDSAVWTVNGLISRDASAAATAFIGVPTVTQDFADASMVACALAVIANTTRGSVELQATGLAGQTIWWYGNLDTVENA